ncbi:MAG TPA: ribosome small subunit-dependent GTPase A [Saprospiraceae bacterium]|nr:ribosome small subunit-dependent GTPase A [Saprospiraceae bacterium]HNT20396.1 ribosome small subunit-dependent GTPase A [Saprospiraceae bacterium]
MTLEQLGYPPSLDPYRVENQLDQFEAGRIIEEHKERYLVATARGEYEAEITGHLRFSATGREDFPAVGDWVALSIHDPDFALIHAILPRTSVIKRQAVGRSGESQIIATNIDGAFLVQAVDRDFNINRLERYLTLCHESGVKPMIVLTKTDLAQPSRTGEILQEIKTRVRDVPVIAISNETREGYAALESLMVKGKTYCLLGSSGVGKSTLLNNLSGRTVMKTGAISESSQRGKHVTSHRELILLDNGAILIDNPGMREVGVADSSSGLETTFDHILSLARDCKFKDCSHTGETGCAVIKAVEQGDIDQASYENYLKMEREKAHYESTLAERRRKERQWGKMFKNYKKEIKKKDQ